MMIQDTKRHDLSYFRSTLVAASALVLLLAGGSDLQAAAGGNGSGGGGNGKPGNEEVGQLIPVQLLLDSQHPNIDGAGGTGPNGMVSDGLRTDPGNPDSYVDGEDGAEVFVGENRDIVLDPNASGTSNPVRSFAFPQGIQVLQGFACEDISETGGQP